jgi:dephospho-CoA kinase
MDGKPVVGLVGGIGSGKSAVAAAFARRGALVINADDLGHQALHQPEVHVAIARRWPSVVDVDGSINRRRLGAIVFAAADERRVLEGLVHPWICRRIEEEVVRAQQDPAIHLIVLDAAVMLEAGWAGVCDRLVYIDAPQEERQRRVASARGWSLEELRAREQAQLPLTQKALRADHVLENAGTLEDLDQRVERLLRLWGLATRRFA